MVTVTSQAAPQAYQVKWVPLLHEQMMFRSIPLIILIHFQV